MTPCLNRDLGELLGSYLLGSCPDAEAAAAARHLRECEACARDAEHLRPARDALFVTVTPVRPSPELKARVMAAVEDQARLFAEARAPADAAPANAVRGVSPRRPHMLRRWQPPVRGWALSYGLIALLALGALLATGLDHGRAPAREIVARVDAVQAPDGRARIRIAGDRARLRVRGFPSAGRGRTYQVWLVTGTGGPRPTRALFGVDAGRASVALPPEALRAHAVLVTSEPRGGSGSPTRPPVMTASL